MSWFLNVDDKILGPFPANQVLEDLKAGRVPYSSYIWAKGQIEWISISEWEDNFDTITRTDMSKQLEQTWKIRSGAQVTSGLNMDRVITTLKDHNNLKSVFISPD